MRKLKAALAFIRNQEWVNEPKWEDEDEKAWTGFLSTPTGQKLSLILLNLTLRQNSSAVMKKAEALYNATNQSNSNRDYKEKYLDMREINKDLKSHFR